ncbi:unnamed protein product, partial [Amoebophrya sp. A25]|eukprot:GSA25T00022332001.1
MVGRLRALQIEEMDEIMNEVISSTTRSTASRQLSTSSATSAMANPFETGATDDQCVLTACQVMRLLSPTSEITLKRDPDAMARLEVGDTEYCTAPVSRQRKRLHAVSTSHLPIDFP